MNNTACRSRYISARFRTVLFLVALSCAVPVGAVQDAKPGEAAPPSATTPTPTPAAQASPGAGLLEVIPADAWAAITWRDMHGFEQKLGRLFGQIDFALPLTPSLGLKAYLNILEGVNEGGDAALVLLAPTGADAAADFGGRSVIVLPAKDYDAMLRGLQPSASAGGISRIVMRDQPSFAARKGGFALFSEKEEALRRVLDAKEPLARKFSPHQLERYAKNDVSAWVNMASITASQEFKEFLKEGGVRALFIDSFKDCRQAQLSIRLAEEGLHSETLWSAGPGPGDALAGVSAGALLAGLPADGYAVAGGITFAHPAELQQWPELLLGLGESGGLLDPVKAKQLGEAYASITKHVKALRVGINAATSGGDGLGSITQIVETDGQTDAVLAGIEAWTGVLKQGPFKDANFNALWTTVEFKRDAETLGGVKVHHVSADWSKIEQVDLPKLQAILGKDAPRLRLGVVGGKHLLITFGGGAAPFEAAAKAIQAGGSPIAELAPVRKALSFLPGEGSARGFLDPAQFSQLIRAIVRELEGTADFAMGDVHDPISVLLRGVGPGSKEYDVFIPVEVVRGLKEAMLVAPPRSPAEPEKGGG
ncbi:MAG: hypothetical protein IT449_08675 [Phycisphaerales bacterium]|nr:hypothetical protein [Phycisphaerales bacterium]